jgi:Na+/H+ antiporter NhaD/arsenite permease-like protein
VRAEFAASKAAREPALAMVGSNGDSLPERDETEHHGKNVLGETFYSAEIDGPANDPETKRALRRCWIILGSLIVLLVTHGRTEHWLGLKEGTMMVAAALVMGCIVLLLSREKARELVERRVDWWTLAFFMMLFASVGTLEDTHVTRVIAERISGSGGSQFATTQLIGWSTGWLSAFLDNVLAVATFMPVVHDIRIKAGVPYSSAIYWFMLFGGTFMGNMTIIGSTANIVAVGLLERRGHGTIKFGYWMKIGFIVSIVSMVVATGALIAVDKLSPNGIPKLEAPQHPVNP